MFTFSSRPSAAARAGYSICIAMASLTACGGDSGTDESTPAPSAQINVLSSRVDTVSGGDTLVQIALPPGVAASQAKVTLNGVDVSAKFVATDSQTMRGLVDGLTIGANDLQVAAGSPAAPIGKVSITNGPIAGPIFAGPHQKPWICETAASGLGPPPASGPCVAPTRYDWFYKNKAGAFVALAALAPPYPSDMAQTTTIDGNVVNYIVRVESGTIDESIYRIAIIDDPVNPISSPWSSTGKKPGIGWNGKLVYFYVGGAGPGYRSGRNTVTAPLVISDSIIQTDDPLSLGFAVATGTRNVFGTGQDDIVSAESTSMIKEHFIKNYGLPTYTVSVGPSGGSMQQHLIANNYPGLLDAIIPDRTFPDQVTIAPDVLDCGLLTNYFTKIANPTQWPIARVSKVDGYPVLPNGTTTCSTGWSGYSYVWQNPSNSQFDSAVLTSLRYDPVTHPTGARGDYWDNVVNAIGIDPLTGFARAGFDNVGVQYGLQALNNGDITKTEFLDLNQKIGGLDVDGNVIPTRSVGDPTAIANAYKSGRVNSATGLTLPIIDYRSYVDLAGGSIHGRWRTFAKIERMLKANGTRDNMTVWTIPTGNPKSPDQMRLALLAMDEWMKALQADTSSKTYAQKVVANRPQSAADACWDANGNKIVEVQSLASTGTCNTLYPNNADPRLVAGAPRSEDILKCQLKPVALSDYKVTFTPAELVRLNSVFPEGVCDWSKPGVNQVPMDGTWLKYGSTPGTWSRLGG